MDRNALWILKMFPQHHHAPPKTGFAWTQREDKTPAVATTFGATSFFPQQPTNDQPTTPVEELGKVERQQRILEVFEATVVGKRLLCFNVYFFNHVAKPNNAPLAEVAAVYDKSYGKPTRRMKVGLQRKMKQIMRMETMQDFYEELGVRSPSELLLEHTLKTAIVNSLRRKYHVPGMLGIEGFETLEVERDPKRLEFKSAGGWNGGPQGPRNSQRPVGERSGLGSGRRRSLQDLLDSTSDY
jgi:hypothetical protein